MSRIPFAVVVSAFPTVVAAQADSSINLPSESGDLRHADTEKFYKKPGYAPYAGRVFPQRPLWGDQHVHTGWSMDAGMAGATLTPEDALRFARGEELTSSTGQPARLSRPLDWVAISDHSDGMGTIAEIRSGNAEFMADSTLKRWRDMMMKGGKEAQAATIELVTAQAENRLPQPMLDPKFTRSVWERNTAIMEKYNEPGR